MFPVEISAHLGAVALLEGDGVLVHRILGAGCTATLTTKYPHRPVAALPNILDRLLSVILGRGAKNKTTKSA